MNPLSLAYSPCPNDTFIFCGIANREIDLEGIRFDIHMHDVEQLNQACSQVRYDVSKISVAALPHFQQHYALLYSGSALGRGCGPLVVGPPGSHLQDISRASIAVPGIRTTAYLLLSLYTRKPLEVTPMPFDQIMPSVARGEYDFGLIIHEGRFTYHNYGLQQLLDLGQWWEQATGLPLPLGSIAIKRDIAKEIAQKVDLLILNSLEWAWKNPHLTLAYVREHAQEMKRNVIKSHIELYVNNYTKDLGTEGKLAIVTLLNMGARIGLLPKLSYNIMAY